MNKEIIDNLQQHQRDSQRKKDRFRTAAYGKAIQQIRSLPYEINNINQIKGLPGIGPKITEKIDLVLKGMPKVAQIDPFYEEVLKIAGIGPVKADYLINVENIKSINELQKKTYLLDDKQKIGLKYYKYSGLRIPRSEMEIHDEILHHIKDYFVENAKQTQYKKGADSLKIDVVGSYRRGIKESGDIDVILTTTNPKIFYCFIHFLKTLGYIKDTLSQGDKLFTGYAQVEGKPPRRIDIIYTTPQEYDFALLYFTGPKRLNEELRLTAKNNGMTLNRYGLFKGNYKVPNLNSEKDIMEYLGYKYLPPFQR